MTQSAYIKQTSTRNKREQFKKIAPSRGVISTTGKIFEAVAPEEIRTVEISFSEHKVYVGEKLMAVIAHDDSDFVTQPWVVTINGIEVHRAETWAKCYSYIKWHHKEGTLPLKQDSYVEEANTSTGNEVILRITTEDEKFEFGLTEDGVCHNILKNRKVGSNSRWWVVRALSLFKSYKGASLFRITIKDSIILHLILSCNARLKSLRISDE